MIINKIKSIVCKQEIENQQVLQQELENAWAIQDQISKMYEETKNTLIGELKQTHDALQLELSLHFNETWRDKRRNYWENKWPKARIIHRAQGILDRDVRTLLCDKSFLLDDFIAQYKLNVGTDDEKIVNI